MKLHPLNHSGYAYAHGRPLKR